MRAVSVALLTAIGLGLAACTNDGPTPEEVQAKLQRGVTGQGRLGPIDRSDDPYVQSRVGGGHRE